jgi:hypothetical protein
MTKNGANWLKGKKWPIVTKTLPEMANKTQVDH